ncbi:MAG: 16S rRNA (guanine(966)-N(2))-methyltransferase RsmD [Deltaproteobacteria bacterium]|nr:16S rRNA (guanine(966)-N(2))-methyltransferase RsmD [Deltaproteobacteria bacterium]
MRVISGLAKGRKLFSPTTLKVRPATDKVKEAIFNILGDLEGVKVLDLFAGTGSVGIEALSRAAAHCSFVEADRNIAAYIEKNLEHCRLKESGQVIKMLVNKAIPFLEKKGGKFDLIFIDPPYDKNLLNPSLELLQHHSSILTPHTLIVCEHSGRELPKAQEKLEINDQRKYGQTYITFLKLPPHPTLSLEGRGPGRG